MTAGNIMYTKVTVTQTTLSFLGNCQDQLVIFMALAKGTSRLRLGKKQSLHFQTATDLRLVKREETRSISNVAQGHNISKVQ